MFRHSPEKDDHLRELREKLRQDSRDSLQLLKNFRDNPICSIILDNASRCIIVVWKQYATEIQFRYIHENLLTLICEHRVCKILGDDTALPTVPSEDRFWVFWQALRRSNPVGGSGRSQMPVLREAGRSEGMARDRDDRVDRRVA
jgi:hypothetical protein